jgi:prephenate dehydratase
MKNITFLAPYGATFSHDAYTALSSAYNVPQVTTSNYLPAKTNGEVVSAICKHGGYGCIAMETRAEGRVAEPLESFIDLLKTYPNLSECPIRIGGAMKMKLHFCMMVRSELPETEIAKLVAHPKALGACKKRIASKGLPTEEVSSNGEAARLVAEDPAYATAAAIGPRSAALKYGLRVIDETFEDSEAVTTFFLIAPHDHAITQGKKNRSLIVFKVHHQPGALVNALLPWGNAGLDLIQIHSVHAGNGTYHFAIEVEVNEDQIQAHEKALEAFKGKVAGFLCFGPFEVLSP